MSLFKNRQDSGAKLARKLDKYRGNSDTFVLGLPRGGVPVAQKVADYLDAPLDVYIVRKLGVPGQEELALGAIAGGGERVLNEKIVQQLDISEETINNIAERERQELERRKKLYQSGAHKASYAGKIAILVDDGLATGASMRAAIQALETHNPQKIIVAVPVAPPETCDDISQIVDEMVCLETPPDFSGVGAWYRDFSQTTDEEVREILQEYETAEG